MLDLLHALVRRPVAYLANTLSARQFLIVSSILVGLTSGLTAVAVKYVVHSIGELVAFYSVTYEDLFLFALFPTIGIFLTVFYVKFFLNGKLHKGNPEIVYSIAKKSSKIPPQETYAHTITSALTVGFGGSMGLESPMVSTGAAIGSNYGTVYKLGYKERTILLGCGASAGIAAAFNSPIAGVLFAIEVLLADVSAAAFIPLIISAASGALLSKIILKEGITLSFSLQQPFDYHNVPYYVLLGLLAGMISLYYARAYSWTEEKMHHVSNRWARAITGGLLMFVMVLIFPPLFGEGYHTIKLLAELNASELFQSSILYPLLDSDAQHLILLAMLIFVKPLAAAVTLGSGGNGGNFAPALFVGAYVGFVFARIINLVGITQIPESNFTIVAMAGILSGIFYAPLTAIFLIAEITGGYELMIPLMIVSALSLTVAHLFEPLSMDSRRLSAMLRGSIDTRDKFLLSKIEVGELIETNFSTVKPDDNLEALIKVIAQSSRNIFPVIDDEKKLIGVVHLDKIRSVVFGSRSKEDKRVRDLMIPAPVVVQSHENLHQVLNKFEETKSWNLPVVNEGVYVGFLSKSTILTRYRNELLESA
ncbi:MAG TPA: chloride channel protein [Chryseosolibacter sp.]|nr:chloride channel protein [Chryseosolibacter sp.]